VSESEIKRLGCPDDVDGEKQGADSRNKVKNIKRNDQLLVMR